MLGAFGGLYSVPLYALIQQRAKRQQLSRIIAANNIINAFFMVGAAGLAIALLNAGLSIPQLFVVLGILNAVVAIYIYSLLPEFLMRFIAWIIVNTLYRIRTTGLENIPEDGPAIIACNHVSFIDGLVVLGSIQRPARFVMWYRIFDIPFLNFLFRNAKAIPIASASEDAEILDKAFEQIDEELAEGNLICIFPEGGITRDGEIQNFRRGIERIVERRPVPVIPVGLSGLWGSWFSRKKSGGLRRIPGKLLARVDIRIGEPVRADEATAPNLELLVRTLRGRKR
jgi:1-acyl-sn-glycerol-3-phosphate acyltransferase